AWMWSEMREHLLDAFRRDEKVAARLEAVGAAGRAGRLSPTTAAHELLAAHGLAGAPEVWRRWARHVAVPDVRSRGGRCGPGSARRRGRPTAGSATSGAGCSDRVP